MKINIAGLDKAEVLLTLFNNAMYLGPTFSSHPEFSKKMIERHVPATLQNAIDEIERRNKADNFLFNHLVLGSSSKSLGVDLSGSEFDSTKYDEYHGKDLAEFIISDLRNKIKEQVKSDAKPIFDEKGNLVLARNINANEKFKTENFGKFLIKGNVGKGAVVDCRDSYLTITGNYDDNVTFHCIGEPTVQGTKGDNATINSYDQMGQCIKTYILQSSAPPTPVADGQYQESRSGLTISQWNKFKESMGTSSSSAFFSNSAAGVTVTFQTTPVNTIKRK